MNHQTSTPTLAERSQASSELQELVSDLRAMRTSETIRRSRPVPFVEIAERIAGLYATPTHREFLRELGALLDQPDSTAIDADLDRLWRKTVAEWAEI